MVHPHRVYPRFLSEQDGPFERCLKEKLAAAFLNDRIIGRAYLARVDLRNGSGESVILGLRTSNYDAWKMLDDIACIFASIFHTAEYLERGGRHQIERINARCRGKQRIVHAHARKQRADGSDVNPSYVLTYANNAQTDGTFGYGRASHKIAMIFRQST